MTPPALAPQPVRRPSPLRLPRVAALLLGALACDPAPDARLLVVTPDPALIVGVGASLALEVVGLAPDGADVPVDGARWRSRNDRVATVDGDGRVVAVGAGRTAITAAWRGARGYALVEVHVPERVESYRPDSIYSGRNGYVEYLPGLLPVILSAPHGGALTPAEIADRSYGVTITDAGTIELTLAVREALVERTGRAPHVVLSRLDRSKLDPNREPEEAAQGNAFAARAWEEYHRYLEVARRQVAGAGGGLYLDMHGHGHAIARLELGYLLTAEELGAPDDELDGGGVAETSSLRGLASRSPLRFSALLRGPTSFGGLLEQNGARAVPSPSDPSPGDDPYFSGGYSTRRHGSLADGGVVDAIQIEHHRRGLRDTAANRRAYADRLAETIVQFLTEHHPRAVMTSH